MKVLSHKHYKKPGQGYSLNGCLHLVTKSLQHQKFRLRNIKDQQNLKQVPGMGNSLVERNLAVLTL